ncbi:MAG: hypothetical protein JWM41_2177 [Gemmatimonadetes bacterium]|nr:hypothetical protein [Gemmatimonadota bacterium]
MSDEDEREDEDVPTTFNELVAAHMQLRAEVRSVAAVAVTTMESIAELVKAQRTAFAAIRQIRKDADDACAVTAEGIRLLRESIQMIPGGPKPVPPSLSLVKSEVE